MLNELSLSGFAHPWYFVCFLAVVVVIAAYLWVQRSRRKHVLRFANMSVLDRVAPSQKQSRWRHVPAALLIAALALMTTAMAGPTDDVRVPRNRAVVMLVIDVSESMAATDVAPSRIAAARDAAARFADQLTPGINLGLVKYSSSAVMLVAPTPNHDAVKQAVAKLQPEPRTSTGEGIYTALQAIATAGAVMGGGDGPPPARIVLESDGKETVPGDPDEPRGAFSAARAARDQHVPISTISFGTPYGTVTIDDQQIPVPVDDSTLQKIVEITHGQAYHAGSLAELNAVYSELEQQVGYETVRGDASSSWIALALLAMAGAVAAGIFLNRRLPL